MPGRSYTGITQNRYGFNGKETDNETYGQGNEYDYGFRIYNPRIGKFLSVDPLTSKYPGWSPYAFAMNCPISGIDLDGLEYYYSSGGTFLGHTTTDANGNKLDDKTANSVKLATSVTQTDNYTMYNGVVDLSISHADFQKAANIIRQESTTGDRTELLYIAHTSVNEANNRNVGVADLLSTTFSSVPSSGKTLLADDNNSNSASYARAGLIHALGGGADPTYGATRWDGTDFLAWGLNGPYGAHQKLREEGVSISEELYVQYLNVNKAKYGNSVRYGGTGYSLPHSVFNDNQYWHYPLGSTVSTGGYAPNSAGFFYTYTFDFNSLNSREVRTFMFPALQGANQGQIQLKATAVAGLSIFWAPNK
jgi:RHS repeat-associated protein